MSVELVTLCVYDVCVMSVELVTLCVYDVCVMSIELVTLCVGYDVCVGGYW